MPKIKFETQIQSVQSIIGATAIFWTIRAAIRLAILGGISGLARRLTRSTLIDARPFWRENDPCRTAYTV
jgi:hypothetical protein